MSNLEFKELKAMKKGLIYIFKRYKVASVLNVAGLAVAFAVCYVMLTQIKYQMSYNKGLDGYENMYRVEAIPWGDNWCAVFSRPLAEEIEKLPQVEEMAMWTDDAFLTCEKDGTSLILQTSKMLPNTLKALHAKCIDGRITFNDLNEEGYIIPASIAKQYFGDVMAAGRQMKLRNGKETPVIGVYEDFPDNVRPNNFIYTNMGEDNIDNIGNWNYTCFLRLVPDTDIDEMNKLLHKACINRYHSYSDEPGWDIEEDEIYFKKIRITPVEETYMSGIDHNDRGSRSTLFILEFSCMLILIVAAINFANFTLAETPMRIKSINTRKVLGSSVVSLRLGLVLENVLISLGAFVFSVVVVSQLAMVPSMSDIIQGDMMITSHLDIVALVLVISILMGVATSLYPSWYVTSFAPALVLKGSFGLSPKGRFLRTILICIQFVISFGMTAYFIVLTLQSHFIFTSDYGFDKDQVVSGWMYDKIPNSSSDAVRQELMNVSGVEDVSFSRLGIAHGEMGSIWSRVGVDGETKMNFKVFFADTHYINTMGIEIAEGETKQDPTDYYYVVNEAMMRNYPDIKIGEQMFQDDETPVVAVCKDMRISSAHVDRKSQSAAFVITNGDIDEWYLYFLNVRIAAGPGMFETRARINEALAKHFTDIPELHFLDDDLEEIYSEEFRFISQVRWFTIISVLITLIGVFCLTMFETEYRRKEIGVRKVMGATTGEILKMFVSHYTKLLLISFVPSVPVVYILAQKWLESFAERTELYWWVFALSLVFVAVITLVVVVVKSLNAASENPVDSVKVN